MHFTPRLYIHASTALHHTACTSIDGLPNILCVHGIPHFLYLHKDSKFAIYQLQPYKHLATFPYKKNVLSFCFSPDGLSMHILTSDSIAVYSAQGYRGKVAGNFDNYTMAYCEDELVVTGNFNIFIFDTTQRADTLFKTESDPGIYYRERLKGTAYCRSACSTAWANGIKVFVKALSDRVYDIAVGFGVKKIVCDLAVRRVYCLATDGSLHVLGLDGSRPAVLCTGVVDFGLSFCEKYCYVVSAGMLQVFEGELLIDEQKVECQGGFAVTIDGEIEKMVDYIKIEQ